MTKMLQREFLAAAYTSFVSIGCEGSDETLTQHVSNQREQNDSARYDACDFQGSPPRLPANASMVSTRSNVLAISAEGENLNPPGNKSVQIQNKFMYDAPS